jgi:hypothetical protein
VRLRLSTSLSLHSALIQPVISALTDLNQNRSMPMAMDLKQSLSAVSLIHCQCSLNLSFDLHGIHPAEFKRRRTQPLGESAVSWSSGLQSIYLPIHGRALSSTESEYIGLSSFRLISYLRELTNYMPGLDPEDTAKR